MVHIRGQFDPETGLALLGRLHNQVEVMFHDQLPTPAPRIPSASSTTSTHSPSPLSPKAGRCPADQK
jgi:hypothetical protein